MTGDWQWPKPRPYDWGKDVETLADLDYPFGNYPPGGYISVGRLGTNGPHVDVGDIVRSWIRSGIYSGFRY